MSVVPRLLRTAAEAASAFMMLALFATFLLQIFSRYVVGQSFSWTLELCLILWVWIVFFGCAFIVRDRDHITFDLLYQKAPAGPRRVMALLGSLAVAGGFLWSLAPTVDWIEFLRIKRSATLRIPMRDIYAIYGVFLAAIIVAQIWKVVRILRGADPDIDGSLAGETRDEH